MRRSPLGGTILLMAVSVLPPRPAAADLTPLSVIPTESRATQPLPHGAPMRVQLQAADLPRLAAQLGVPAPDAGVAGLDYTVDAAAGARAVASGRTWLEPTFVIDYDDPRVLALRDEYRSGFPGAPSAATLAQFVSGRMRASSDQPFALASVLSQSFVVAPRLANRQHLAEHRVEEETHPHAFAAAALPDAIHAVVPVAAAEERQPMRPLGQALVDGAEAVFEQRGVFARDRGLGVRLLLIRE